MIKHRFFRSERKNEVSFGVILLFSTAFLIGASMGIVLPVDTLPTPICSLSDASPRDYLNTFLSLLRFAGMLFIASTSLLGVGAAPAILASVGYHLSLSSASFNSLYPDAGIFCCVLYLGFPAVLTLPCSFVLGFDAFYSSASLLHLETRTNRIRGVVVFFRHFFMFLPLYLLSAAVEVTLLPRLIGLMID